MTSKEIRNAWIKFFESKNHLYIPSKSLIPYKDPSLLWINSGVATLKDYFSGKKVPPSKRLVNSQKAIRTNDIENVGVTARHHTFFEMLGNFSIGDYFKNEAIEFANEFIIDILKLDKNKIYITYFNEDLEVQKKLLSLGYLDDQLIPGDRNLNFWDVGSGPCGPNIEIFYDRGEIYHSGGRELIQDDIENDRYVEIWNIVFSQYNNLGNGEYIELAQKNIDTGAGLERITAILQNAPTNFDTDLFQKIIREIEKYTSFKYDVQNYFSKDPEQAKINKHFKIISDHMRAIVNAINDGAEPSNNQRGYIIRWLIRRAYYSGIKLNIQEKTFLHKFVQVTKDTLIFDIDVPKVSKIIMDEEENFSKTIMQGKKILEDEIIKTKNDFNVNIAFKLFETYGFPIEMTKDILLENNLNLDLEKLEKLKLQHSAISRGTKEFNNFSKAINSLSLIETTVSQFVGYEHLESKSKILYLLDDKNIIEAIDGIAYLVLDKTPFYATSGGQIHDEGYLKQMDHTINVIDVFKDKNNNHIHKIEGKVDRNSFITCYVDPIKRLGSTRNHSATHILFSALRHIYGDSIMQKGSDINSERFTFDFPLKHRPTSEEVIVIENFVNNVIQENIKREYIVTTTTEAKKMGALMTIDEMEYFNTENVRVVKFGNVTTDLCGGTHVDYTKDIEKFKIIDIESKGTGIYRIKAITSNLLVNKFLNDQISLKTTLLEPLVTKINNLSGQTLSYSIDELTEDIDLEDSLKHINSKIDTFKEMLKKLLKPQKQNLNLDIKPVFINNTEVIFDNNIDPKIVKNAAIKLREKSPNALIILLSKFQGTSVLVITSKTIDTQLFVSKLSQKIIIKGGGNKVIWQGIASEKITIKNIEKLI